MTKPTAQENPFLARCPYWHKPFQGAVFCDDCFEKQQQKLKAAIEKVLLTSSEENADDVHSNDVDISGEPLQVMNTSDLLTAQQHYTREDHTWAMNDSYWGRNPRDRD